MKTKKSTKKDKSEIKEDVFTKLMEDNHVSPLNGSQSHPNSKRPKLIPQISIDSKLKLHQITAQFYKILKQFSPTGPGNMRPIFMSENVFITSNSRKIGEDKTHLRLEVFQEENPNVKFNCIGFGLGGVMDDIDEGMPISIVYNIEENHWNGNTTLQLNLKDIKVL